MLNSVGEVMYFVRFDFRGELGFLNCDDICMCVVASLSSPSLFYCLFVCGVGLELHHCLYPGMS